MGSPAGLEGGLTVLGKYTTSSVRETTHQVWSVLPTANCQHPYRIHINDLRNNTLIIIKLSQLKV